MPVNVIPVPRLTGRPDSDMRAIAEWAFDQYQTLLGLVREQEAATAELKAKNDEQEKEIKRLEDRLAAIGKLDFLPVDGTATTVQIADKVNAVIETARLPPLD